jgi:hypothetical protein
VGAQEKIISTTSLIAPGAGFQWPYYLYLPAAHSVKSHLLVVPNNAGQVDADPVRAEREAYDKMLHMQLLSEQLGCPLLVPTFPRSGNVYATSLSRETMLLKEGKLFRPDLQLLAMIDDARSRLEKRDWHACKNVHGGLL